MSQSENDHIQCPSMAQGTNLITLWSVVNVHMSNWERGKRPETRAWARRQEKVYQNPAASHGSIQQIKQPL